MAVDAIPRISVIVTCFNEGILVRQAVESALAQAGAFDLCEVLVVDDGSAADTLRVLGELEEQYDRVRVLHQRQCGLSANRNEGARQALGDWVAFLDADDWWDVDKTGQQVAKLTSTEADLCYGSFFIINEDDGMIDVVIAADISEAPDAAVRYFRYDAPIIPSSVIIRKSSFLALGGFDESISVFEDTEFFFRCVQHLRISYLQCPLVWKRERPGSVTSRRGTLLFNHALIACKLAERQPQLWPLVAERLSGRARGLALVEASLGSSEMAGFFISLSCRLSPFSIRSRLLWLAISLGLPLGRLRRYRALRGYARYRRWGVT